MAWSARQGVVPRAQPQDRVSVSSVENNEVCNLAALLVMINRLNKLDASEILTTCISEVMAAISPQIEEGASMKNRRSL